MIALAPEPPARPSVLHLPFFEVLAGMDEALPGWRSVAAGVVALRLVDRWKNRIARGETVDRMELAAVEDAVDAVDSEDAVRRLLTRLIEALRAGSAAGILPTLMAYARTLQYEGSWTLAADVYDSVEMHADEEGQNVDLAIQSAMQRGYCLRMAGDLEAAERAYHRGAELAAMVGDRGGELRAELGRANLLIHRGNLPQAETLLDLVITQAEAIPHSESLWRALHDRAQVAGRRGQLEESLLYAHRALECCENHVDRDRILADMATTLAAMGQRDAARDTYLILCSTASEQEVRWASAINLLELAALDGSEPLFERYRRELSDASLPPSLAAHFHLHVGEGSRRFGRHSAAELAFQEAISVAQRHSVNEVLVRAESSLRAVSATSQRAAPDEYQPSAAVGEVIRAISDLRASAGISGG